MTTIASWEHVSRSFGAVHAVRDVTLELAAGEVTALVGHNGAGKTTLIKLLLGLIEPDSGHVRVAGLDPAGSRGAQARASLGFLPESAAFHPALTANEVMALYSRLKSRSATANRDLLAQVGLADAAGRRVGTYSKGMRQRLGIAQSLIGEPRLLVFDEPTSGLDPASRAEIYDTIGRLRAGGATVLVSTHALAEIEPQADRVAIMHRGELRAAGSIAQLRERASALARVIVHLREPLTPGWLAKLPEAVRVIAQRDRRIELAVPVAGKLDALRAILSEAAAPPLDVEVIAPGLQQLYEDLIGAEPDAPHALRAEVAA